MYNSDNRSILCDLIDWCTYQVDWFNYVTLLQWKMSNDEVSLLGITSSCCSQKLVASNQCMK